MKKPKVKKLSIKKEKARAWKAFSEYVRTHTAFLYESDIVPCYTCEKNLPWKEMQCGHAIGGWNNSILFSEDLCRVQCVGCNVFGRGKYAIFTFKLIKELGMDKYEQLVALSQETKQYKAIDYVDIREKYEKKLEELGWKLQINTLQSLGNL